MSQQLVDLHCHILPGIDDGAKNIEISMEMLRRDVQSGVAGVVFTPHFNYERTTVEEFCQKRREAFRKVQQRALAEKLPLAAKLGAEIYFSAAIPSLDLKKLAFTQSRYLLIEFPTTFHPPGIPEVLFDVMQQGYIPILAHVERYPFVEEEPTLLYDWVQAGALAQINASAMIRGGATAKRLRQYISWDLIHLVCSDCHSLDHRPPNLAEGYAALEPAVQQRFRRNAVDVYLDKDIVVREPKRPVYRFGQWR